jgi:hypothetical protein
LIALACAPFVPKIAGAAAAAVPETIGVISPGSMVYGWDPALPENDQKIWIIVNPRDEASPTYECYVQGDEGTWWKRIA